MNYKKVVNLIEEIAPPHLAEAWDNSGVQINVGKNEIKRILTCLEITDTVIEESIEEEIDMIISHHPLLFNKLKKVDIDDVVGKYVSKLINNNISVYSAHLSFDNAPMGNNYYLAKKLNLKRIARPVCNPENIPGVVGEFDNELTLEKVCCVIENALELPKHYIRVVGNKNMMINKVGICTGGGGDFLDVAIDSGCNLFITGDVKFHQAQYAKAIGIGLVDAGHFGTEKIFAENFTQQLNERSEDLIILESNVNGNPYMVY